MLGYLRISINICGSRSVTNLCLIRLQIRGSRLSVLVPTCTSQRKGPSIQVNKSRFECVLCIAGSQRSVQAVSYIVTCCSSLTLINSHRQLLLFGDVMMNSIEFQSVFHPKSMEMVGKDKILGIFLLVFTGTPDVHCCQPLYDNGSGWSARW